MDAAVNVTFRLQHRREAPAAKMWEEAGERKK